jgi:PmbA protein
MSRNPSQIKHNSTDASSLAELVAQCIDLAARAGADGCEVAAAHNRGLSVTVRLGDVETVEHINDRSIGVTVYFGQRRGSADTADFSPQALRDTVAAACRIARHTGEDPHAGLPDQTALALDAVDDLDLDHPWVLDASTAIKFAKRSEDAARGADTRISNSDGATVTSHRGVRCLGNSLGLLVHSASTRHTVSCVVIATQDGEMERDYWYSTARDEAGLDEPETVGLTAAQRTVRRLGARRLGTQHASVLFAPETARGLFGHLLSAASGSAQYRKASFLLGARGQQVLPDWMSVQEDPWIKRGAASARFDAEGVATQPQTLVDDGRLENYLLDSYSARRLGLETNGHSGGWTNVSVTGTGTQEELMTRMGTGFLVTELMGQGVNAVTGDYSRGAAGFWVEGGQLAFPVHEVTIAANLKDMLRGIVAVGADHDPRHGLRVGSTLVADMSVAGD